MKQRWFMLAAGAVGLLFALAPYGGSAEADKPPADAAAEKDEKIVLTAPLVIKLEEAPALGKQELGGTTRVLYPRGPYVICSPLPAKEIKKLPTLKAKRPMYGSITIGGSATDAAAGAKFHFVFDQTEEPKEEPKAEAPADTPPPRVLQGLKADKLYFDADGDGDLTNDKVVELTKKSPFDGLPGMANAFQVFDEVKVEVDGGQGVGKQTLRIVPVINGPVAYFVPAAMRRGKFELGGKEYLVQLSQGQQLTPRFDLAATMVEFLPAAGGRGTSPLISGTLGMLRSVGGELCTLSVTPRGDQLTIGPYKGDTGMLEVGAGGRAITRMGVAGVLEGEKLSAPMGTPSLATALLPRGHKLPVGDYAPTTLLVDYGRLRFAARTISDAYLQAAGMTRKPAKYNIVIRKDKPFVMEFSGKPEVIFLGPQKNQEFKVGSAILIRVMLAEPENGLMITGLWTKQDDVVKPDESPVARQEGITPTITINNAKGEEVAQGKLPFGWGGTCGYSWRVPNDLKLAGDKETFTAHITYDTLDLYGKVEVTCPITIVAGDKKEGTEEKSK